MEKEKISIVGLGYVGLPLLCAIEKSKKYDVVGYDISEEQIALIKKRICPITDEICEKEIKELDLNVSSDPEILVDTDIFIVCVPTPIYEDYTPNYEPLKSAISNITNYLKKGDCIIVESTINPGTCDEIVAPLIEDKCSFIQGKDYTLAHCPERINPGDPKWNVYNIPRNLGASTKDEAERLANLYRDVLDAEINVVSTIKIAESTKIVENTFRDINIAYVNELAKSFEKMGIDLVETLEGAANKPFAFMPHKPGCGVGGHCIAVDPYYLIKRAAQSGFDHQFLKVARGINNSMPQHTVDLLVEQLNIAKKPVNGTKILLLGLSYKGNVADLRESPALEIEQILRDMGADLSVFEPYLLERSDQKDLISAVAEVEAVLVATDHKIFKDAKPSMLFDKSKVKVVIDGRNIWRKIDFENIGILYKGIGQ